MVLLNPCYGFVDDSVRGQMCPHLTTLQMFHGLRVERFETERYESESNLRPCPHNDVLYAVGPSFQAGAPRSRASEVPLG